MSDEIAPITLTILYEMMADLTRRIEGIKLILSEYPSSVRGALGVVMLLLPHLTSPTSLLWVPHIHNLTHIHAPFLIHYIGYIDITSILASGPSGHYNSSRADIWTSSSQYVFFIPTSSLTMHADTPSPTVPDLIDLEDHLWYYYGVFGVRFGA
ncbi:hypothetical protein AAG906_007417 [Vitis piasezkii]